MKGGVVMSVVYENNEQIAIEIKKLMLDSKITQREIAASLEIKPQGLTKLLSKKNFGFEDADKILAAMGYRLVVEFEKIQ
jgi:transcriptional regulator with XRE-family HTH domain